MAAQQLLTVAGRLGAALAVGAYILPQVIFDVDGGERAVLYDAMNGIHEVLTLTSNPHQTPNLQTPS